MPGAPTGSGHVPTSAAPTRCRTPWGNVDGENVASGPLTGGALPVPGVQAGAWNFPDGDLAIDQRHRARLWINYGVPRVEA